MKKITILFLFLLATLALCAQRVPQIVNFSAVLRDSVGNIMSDTRVRVKLVFLLGGPEGSSVYTTETTTTTNPNGYVNLLLNRGMVSYGTPFEQIPWGNGNLWLRVDYKTDDMADYRTQGCYELTSNFYAFMAKEANRLEGIEFYAERAEDGDALVFNLETGRFEARAIRPPEFPALSVVLEAGNNAGGATISNLANPVAASDIVTKEYADSVYHRIMAAITNINCSHNGHEYVDLGLPSGTMWAKCNVGAATPESLGDFYAWGEIYAKNYYYSSNYVYAGEQGDSLPADADVASVFWGGGWHVPTVDEMVELRSYCVWKYVQQSGRNGFQVTGPNGSSIFLPCGGYKYRTYHSGNNTIAMYITASAGTVLDCLSYRLGLSGQSSYMGFEIRPVFRFENNN